MNLNDKKLVVIGVGDMGTNSVNGLILQNKNDNVEFAVFNVEENLTISPLVKQENNLFGNVEKDKKETKEEYIAKAIGNNKKELNKLILNSKAVLITTASGNKESMLTVKEIAKMVKDRDILTSVLVKKPFGWENNHQEELRKEECVKNSDVYIEVESDGVREYMKKNALKLGVKEMFNEVDKPLKNMVDFLAETVKFDNFAEMLKDVGEGVVTYNETKEEENKEQAIQELFNNMYTSKDLKDAEGIKVILTVGEVKDKEFLDGLIEEIESNLQETVSTKMTYIVDGMKESNYLDIKMVAIGFSKEKTMA